MYVCDRRSPAGSIISQESSGKQRVNRQDVKSNPSRAYAPSRKTTGGSLTFDPSSGSGRSAITPRDDNGTRRRSSPAVGALGACRRSTDEHQDEEEQPSGKLKTSEEPPAVIPQLRGKSSAAVRRRLCRTAHRHRNRRLQPNGQVCTLQRSAGSLPHTDAYKKHTVSGKRSKCVCELFTRAARKAAWQRRHRATRNRKEGAALWRPAAHRMEAL